MITIAEKFFLDAGTKPFFSFFLSPQDYFFLSQEFLSCCKKKFLLQEKISCGKENKMFSYNIKNFFLGISSHFGESTTDVRYPFKIFRPDLGKK